MIAAIAALLCARRGGAIERFQLKPDTVYCASPQPLVTGHIYPLTTSGCEQLHTPWALVGRPTRARLGIMRVDMGGNLGVRYVKAFSVVREGEATPAQGSGK